MTHAEREAHRRFLNDYYRYVRHVYDPTRKAFLFGRDRALAEILNEPWARLVEVGPGTGRNLVVLHGKRPAARYGGIEASDAMLDVARRRCPWATIRHGFAEDADYGSVLGARPDRILFSYCLSMVQDRERALVHARRSLAPGGVLTVVDFGDMASLPIVSGGMRRFLRSFHVEALAARLLERHDATIRWGPGRYYVIASMSPLPT